MNFSIAPNKKVYFASDLHLMMAPDELSRCRELDFVQWLETIKSDAAAIFLLGDVFDFWHEYRHVVPRGFVRLLGKLAELTDSGIPIHFFTGNHDQWIRNYLPYELNINIYHKPTEFEINNKTFLIGHGHEVSLKNFIERVIHFFFSNRLFRMLFAMIHPFWGVSFGTNWSKNHRRRLGNVFPFKGVENELIYRYVKKIRAEKHYDFFVFGHRHLAMDIRAGENSRYINIGEWMEKQTFAVFDGKDMTLYSAKGEIDYLRIDS